MNIVVLVLASDSRAFPFVKPRRALEEEGHHVHVVLAGVESASAKQVHHLMSCDGIILQPFFRADLQRYVTILSTLAKRVGLKGTVKVPPIIVGGPSIRKSDCVELQNHWPGDVYFCSQSTKAVTLILSNFASQSPLLKPLDSSSNLSSLPSDPSVCQRLPYAINITKSEPTEYIITNHRISLAECWPQISEKTLFQLHLGYRGAFEKDKIKRLPTAVQLEKKVDDMKTKCESLGLLAVEGVSLMAPAVKKGRDEIECYIGNKKIDIKFPRLIHGDGQQSCLADYISTEYPRVGFFAVTSGHAWIKEAAILANNHEWDSFFILHALAMQTAEAGAACIHEKMEGQSPKGKRYSPGYASCPDLSYQSLLLNTVFKEWSQVKLTASMMMDPENSVSGFVFFDPKARY